MEVTRTKVDDLRVRQMKAQQMLRGELAGRDLDEVCDEVLARMLPARSQDDVALAAVRVQPTPAAVTPSAAPTSAAATGRAG